MLPELQQICGVQFGSGTNPGGHVTVSFGATVIFCVDGPLEYFHTHLPHFRLCVSEILWPSLMHVGLDTFLSSGLHGIAAVDHSSWILMRRRSNLMSQGEFKLNVAAGMTFSSVRESRRGHHCKARLDRSNDGSRSAGEGLLRITVFPFSRHNKIKWNTSYYIFYLVISSDSIHEKVLMISVHH